MDVKETELINGYLLEWTAPYHLRARVSRLRVLSDGQVRGELEIRHLNGTEESILLVPTQFNFSSEPTRFRYAKQLSEKLGVDIEWREVFDRLCMEVQERARAGEPVVGIGKRPEKMKHEYQLRPILEEGQPTTVYGPGGFGKSYLAAYIACLVQFGGSGLGGQWVPERGNALLLDYESSRGDHERRAWAIKQGLGMDTEDTFLYRFCSQPLVSDITSLQRLVAEHGIRLVIIDSQMAAAGYGPDPSQVSSQYYNALRSLRCTTLTLDHVSKAEWAKLTDADSTGPFGSVVKFNRSRSQFEIKKSQRPGEDFMELALVHRKHNEGRLLEPIGIRIEFHNNTDGDLQKVTFTPCEISENPELAPVQALKDRLISLLGAGSMSVKDLAGELEKPEGTIRAILNRHKDHFLNVGKEWELRSYELQRERNA